MILYLVCRCEYGHEGLGLLESLHSRWEGRTIWEEILLDLENNVLPFEEEEQMELSGTWFGSMEYG